MIIIDNWRFKCGSYDFVAICARIIAVNYSSAIYAYAIKILMIYSSLDYRANHQKLKIVRITLLYPADDISIDSELILFVPNLTESVNVTLKIVV